MSNAQNPTRRTVTKGAVWAAPVIGVGAAAPSVAASTNPPVYAIQGATKFNQNWTATSLDNRYSIKVYSTANGSTPGQGFCVSNTTTQTKITNVTATYWFAASNLSFARSTTYGDACWTTLTRDTSKATTTYNGCTYYAYTATLTCAVTAAAGSTCLPTFAVESGTGLMSTSDVCDLCSSSTCSTKLSYFVQSSATINAKAQTLTYGPIAVR